LNKENKEKVKSNVCLICNRPTHKKSKYCIFHAKPEEKTKEEFIEKLKEYINEIKEKDKDYNFKDFIFVGDIIDFKKEFDINYFLNVNFEGAIFQGFTNFERIIFQGYNNFNNAKFFYGANFKSTTFKGDLFLTNVTFHSVVTFEQAIFLKNAYFGETIFLDDATFNNMTVLEANFTKTTFKKFALFIKTNFRRQALFWYARFEGITYFNEATFPSIVNFTEASFKVVTFEKAIFKNGAIFSSTIFGVTNFEETNFLGNIFFNDATFRGITKFILIGEQNNLDFTYSKFNSGISVIIEIRKGEINFKNAILENISLNFKIERDVLVNFERAVLKNTQLKRKDIEFNIIQERKNKFSEAKEIYLTLKNNFHSTGRYDNESWAFKKEKDMERKSYSHFKTFHKWLWSCFLNGIFGYGEQPGKVIISAISIILIFTFLFMSPGISGTGIGGSISKNFLDCVYFSVVTFTTLGYGDFHPLEGWGRIFAGTEAFIGALMMALFVYTFARRTGGR